MYKIELTLIGRRQAESYLARVQRIPGYLWGYLPTGIPETRSWDPIGQDAHAGEGLGSFWPFLLRHISELASDMCMLALDSMITGYC